MRILINETNLNIHETGSGSPTLVFMHYFGGSGLEWQSVMNQLSDRYRCIAIDLPGHGDSDESVPGYAVDTVAEMVAALAETLQTGPFVLIGHSMSGKIAMAVAAGTPDRPAPPNLKALVLVSPSPPVPEPIPDTEREKLLNGYGSLPEARKRLKNITAKPISDSVQNQIVADDLRTARSAWDAWLLHGSRETISERMADITIPIHIIVGSDDRALPPDVQPKLVLPYLRTATLDLLNGAGHLLPWEVPDELAAFIAKKVTA
ncbi:alpha/beta hydrolase [Spirosoma montaniterrae]|uniref:Alpha/beta hydrolase n=2 Tax=Spirosoma montaniterrae TaxID=1178516 RepID=A0A1P9X1G2_9BACT|nr:alpha/beta hydrolase [Spirosoma montaniterrae]